MKGEAWTQRRYDLSMDQEAELFRNSLNKEFNNRKLVNARYSLRAFAQYLSVDHSSLSKIMSGQRPAPRQFIDVVEKKLGIISPKTTTTVRDEEVTYLSSREFQVIANWEHFAMLDLVTLDDFQMDYAWIARKLGIKEVDARLVVDRLLRMGMLKEENGTLMKAQNFFSNHLGEQTNTAKKEYQRQLLGKALEAIDHCDPSDKDITSITIAADPKRMDVAREKIKLFRRELCAFLEGGVKTELLHLTVQLCPVKVERKKS